MTKIDAILAENEAESVHSLEFSFHLTELRRVNMLEPRFYLALYLDEDVPWMVSQHLRSHGYDVE